MSAREAELEREVRILRLTCERILRSRSMWRAVAIQFDPRLDAGTIPPLTVDDFMREVRAQ